MEPLNPNPPSRAASPVRMSISTGIGSDADSQYNLMQSRYDGAGGGLRGAWRSGDIAGPFDASAGPSSSRDTAHHQPNIASHTTTPRHPSPTQMTVPVVLDQSEPQTHIEFAPNTFDLFNWDPTPPHYPRNEVHQGVHDRAYNRPTTPPTSGRLFSVFPMPHHSPQPGPSSPKSPAMTPQIDAAPLPESRFSDDSEDDKPRKTKVIFKRRQKPEKHGNPPSSPIDASDKPSKRNRSTSAFLWPWISRDATGTVSVTVPHDEQGGNEAGPSGKAQQPQQQQQEQKNNEHGRKHSRGTENRDRGLRPGYLQGREAEDQRARERREAKGKGVAAAPTGFKAKGDVADSINKALPDPPRAHLFHDRYQAKLGESSRQGGSRPNRIENDDSIGPALQGREIQVLWDTAVDGAGGALVASSSAAAHGGRHHHQHHHYHRNPQEEESIPPPPPRNGRRRNSMDNIRRPREDSRRNSVSTNDGRNAMELLPDTSGARAQVRIAPPPPDNPNRRFRWMPPPKGLQRPSRGDLGFVITIFMAHMLTQAEFGQMLAVLDKVLDTFGVPNQMSSVLLWLVLTYTLLMGVFSLLSGRLGERYGYRNAFMAGAAWCGLWFAIAGVSCFTTNSDLFIFCRAMSGIGAALVASNALALLGDTYQPSRRKNLVFTLFATAAPVGWVIGAAIANALSRVWLPLPFFVLAALCFLVLAISRFTIRPGNAHGLAGSFYFTMTYLDMAGALEGMAGLIQISYALIQGISDGWASSSIWMNFIAGCTLILSWTLIEIFTAKNPIVPTSALATNISLLLVAGSCAWASCAIWFFYTWQFLANLRGFSPLLVTAALAPIPVVSILTTLGIATLIDVVGIAIVMLASLTSLFTSVLLTATMPQHQMYWTQAFFSSIFMGLGINASIATVTILLSNAIREKEHQGTAAGFTCSAIQYSMTLGLSIASTVESGVWVGTNSKLSAYRAALYLGLAFTIIGVSACVGVLWRAYGPRRAYDCATKRFASV